MANLTITLFTILLALCTFPWELEINNDIHEFWNPETCVWTTQKGCTRKWRFLKQNSSLSYVCSQRQDNIEGLEFNYCDRGKNHMTTSIGNYTRSFHLPHILKTTHIKTSIDKSECTRLWQDDIKMEKNIFRLLFILAQCFIIFSDVRAGFKFYRSDPSSSAEKVRRHNLRKTNALKPHGGKLSFSNKNTSGAFKTETFTSFIFRFRRFNIEQSFVYPASLEHYFRNMFSSKQSKSDLLNYEWARYESFRNYPESAVVMPLLLAKDGFYFTGYEDEVTCYFCGLTYRNWKIGDNVHNIHCSLSKNCTIITGGQTNNVSINEWNGDACYDKAESASGGPSDTNIIIEKLDGLRLNKTTGNENLPNIGKRETLSKAHNKDIATGNRDGNITSIVTELPKYPRYAVESGRLSSYTKWPTVVEQSPQILCDAGFFYGGYGDCVRCFFCGGGLRNWEYGDTPWNEHARWYPNCGYLLKRKGRQFIETHRQDYERNEEMSQAGASSEHQKLNDSQPPQHLPLQTENITSSSKEDMPNSDKQVKEEKQKCKLKEADVCEKSYLSGSTYCQSLMVENQQLKDQLICKICMDNNACMVYLPCGHMVSCQKCASTIRKCCICRQLIKGTVKAFL